MSTTGVRALQVWVLGPIGVELDEPAALGGPTQRRVLAVLVLHAGEVVSVDRLVEVLWPAGDVPDRADRNVRSYVHRLRSALGDDGGRVETVGNGYRLGLERHELDAARFEDLVAEGRAAAARDDHDEARRCFDDALALWGGRPYDEFADEEWARAEVARLEELRASAVEHRNAALLDAGRHTEVIGELRDAATEQPWREVRRMQLALALYRSGRQAEALQVLQDYRSELVEGLGLDPSPELGRLEHQILVHDPELSLASHRRHALRGYQLDEVVGEGAFALVWRGVQPSLGRTVAVKQIRAELANRPDFVRRFETEAQTVAMLEHPYIVPLYDYWREPNGAYLVMRYVAGGSLESEVLHGGLDDVRLRRFVDQAGSALEAAHRMGVIHRDVKAANVLLDDADNFYLTDFGIAFVGSVAEDELATSLSTGSPAYASPEQLRRQSLDVRTDIYGFGITLFEAATGRLPFADAPTEAALVRRQLEEAVPAPSSVEPSVPRWVDEVVARATAKNPADRYASMVELMAAVPPRPGEPSDTGLRLGTSTVIGDLVNPFKALRAFREADAADFFGRDRLVARFVEVLSQPGSAGRLLAVVGPSGSGKSSVVRSGLVPSLRRGAVTGSADWFVTTMLPGAHPFDELESALSRVAVRQPGPLVEIMRSDERGIARAVNQILPDETSELLVVIDQFEELFTHGDTDETMAFVDGLVAALREPRARLRLVLTIRADFWDRPLRHPALAARLESAAVTVSPLATDELEAAIVEPVRRQGAQYEPGLVARIMADVRDQPGALPLLQYALTELFDTHVSGLLRTESYDEIGGLTGALAKRAEQTFAAMSTDRQAATRRLFGRLVTPGEGTEDTRRRVRLGELTHDPDTDAVIEAFGDARLLVFDHDPATREPTVELAHEALIRAWPRLRNWLDEDRDGLRIHRHLTETTAAWLTSGRDPGELYRGGRLETAAAWAQDHRPDLNTEEREFLDASMSAREAELAAERDRVEHQARSNRRLRVAVAVASVVALMAAVAGVVALQQRSRADDNAAEARARAGEALQQSSRADDNAAEARAQTSEALRQRDRALAAESAGDFDRLVAQARTADVADPTLGLLLAVEASRFEQYLGAGLPAESSETNVDALSALHWALTARRPRIGALPAGGFSNDMVVLGDGVRVVLGSGESIEMWDVATRQRVDAWPLGAVAEPSVLLTHFDASPDGNVIVVGGAAETLVIAPATGDTRRFGHDSAVTRVRVSPSGSHFALGHANGRLEVRSTDTLDIVAETEWTATISDLAWHPDGQQLAVGTFDSTIAMWSTVDGAIVWTIPGAVAQPSRTNATTGLLFRSDGSELVVSTQGIAGSSGSNNATGVRSIRRLDPATGAELHPPVADPRLLVRFEWRDGDESALLGGPFLGGSIVLVDLDDGSATEVSSKPAASPAFGVLPDLGLLAVPNGSTVELSDLDGSGPLAEFLPLTAAQQAEEATFLMSAFDADGSSITISSFPRPIAPYVWDLDETEPAPEPFVAPSDGPTSLFVRGDSRYSQHSTPEGNLFRDGLTGPAIGPVIPYPDGVVRSTSLSPRGDRFTVTVDDSVRLYDVASGSELAVLDDLVQPEGNFTLTLVEFSPDGSFFHAFNGGNAARYRADDGELVWTSTDYGWSWPGPDSEWMMTPEAGGLITVRDPESHEPIGSPLVGHTGVATAFDATETADRVITGSVDGTARVWDVEARVQLGRELEVGTRGLEGVWSPDGTKLAIPRADLGGLVVWNYDTDTWADIACEVAGRNLTRAEWNEYGPRTIEYRPTCEQYPIEE